MAQKDCITTHLLNTSAPVTPVTVQVIKIERYVMDCKAGLMLPFECPDKISSIYDITVTDNVSKLKCVLHPTMNELIESGDIRRFGLIIVKNYKLWYDESKPGGGNPFLVICETTSLSDIEDDLTQETDLQDLTPKDKLFVPIIGERGYYVSLWNNDCFDDNHESIFPKKLEIQEERKIIALEQSSIKIDFVKSFFLNGNQATVHFQKEVLIGRIIRKSQINHHASINDHHKSFPMNFEMTIASQNATINVVVWNRKCADYYYGLCIGMVVAITNFRVQRSHITGQIEVGINSNSASKKLSGEIFLLPADYSLIPDDMEDEELEDQSESLINLRLLDLPSEQAWSISIPDGFIFDFAGEITFVGRMEREKINNYQYKQYRWITIMDFLHPNVQLLMKVHTAGSRLSIFENLQPGQKIIFYNLTIYSIFDNFYRRVFLTTSPDTQLISFKQVIDDNWASTETRSILTKAYMNYTRNPPQDIQEQCISLLDTCFYPGIPTLYPLSTDINALQGLVDSRMIFLQEISAMMNQLALGEHIQCITQGYIDDINLSGVVDCTLSGRKAMQLNIKLVNINRTNTLNVCALIACKSKLSFQNTVNSLTNFFPSILFAEGGRTSALRSISPSKNNVEVTTAFYNFKHRILDKRKLQKQILGFTLHGYRKSCDELQIFLIPPHILHQ